MRKFLGIALLIGITSCSARVERAERPDNLIQKKEMVEIITELVKLEAHLQASYPSVAEYNKVMLNSGNKLFEKFGISHDQFEASIDYYGSRQDKMKEIYNEALDKLNSELGELEALQESDSLQ